MYINSNHNVCKVDFFKKTPENDFKHISLCYGCDSLSLSRLNALNQI